MTSPGAARFMAVAYTICILITITHAVGRQQSFTSRAPPARCGGWWAAEALRAEAAGSGRRAGGTAAGPGPQ